METRWIFRLLKLHRKKYVKIKRFFRRQNYIAKSTWKQRGFLDQQNYVEKVRGNDSEIRRNLLFDKST